MHPREGFRRHLDTLDDAFTTTAADLGEAMPDLYGAYLRGDTACLVEARRLAHETYARMREVEDAGLVILAREAPVGRDLRRVVAILRLVRDVVRSASLVRHVCETLRRIDPRALPGELQRFLHEIGGRSTEVYLHGVEAWRRRDALAVTEVDDLDELVDRLQLRLYAELSVRHGLGDGPLVVGLVARYHERIADHGVAIARDTSFVATGDRVGSPA